MLDNTLTALIFPVQKNHGITETSVIATTFSEASSYVPGDYVIYQEQLYKCATNVSPGLWNSNQWTSVLVGTELKRLSTSIGSITIYANNWTAGQVATQEVTVEGVNITSRSKVDLQPTDVQLASLMTTGICWIGAKNENGTVYVYSIGDYPHEDMTMQCTVTDLQ